MSEIPLHKAKPHIVVSEIDHKRLTELANAAEAGPFAAVGEDLYVEMDRAEVVPTELMPPDVVRMGSTTEYRTDSGERRQVILVFPEDADIAANRISILTPIGAALIGLKAGQSIIWRTRGGEEHELTVEAVSAPPDPNRAQ
ncbi:nucleoside diphosphate kinase regulator [Tardiphaga sp.]|jgi:regulator of nucleoside diphosphate kinase|uniref:nucleoside diphosphate kinase regulator n=1 Tax=Tardiphaga sp. TaxID=1926292 RepID=UPI0037DA3941